MLTTFETLYLLALDEDKGNILKIAKNSFPCALAGAVLTELALQDKICLNEKDRLEVQAGEPPQDELLAEVWREIKDSSKARKLTYWITQLSDQSKKLREQVTERLVGQKVLFREDKHAFRKPALDTSEAAPAGEPAPSKFHLKQPLRALILDNAAPDLRPLALLNVLSACELLGLAFTADEVPQAGKTIHQAILRAALENPEAQTLEALEQALAISLETD